MPENVSNSVQIPENSSPVNYSGTQINFWGCAPNIDPGNWLKQAQNQGMGAYSNPYPNQLGAMTNKMIQVVHIDIYNFPILHTKKQGVD